MTFEEWFESQYPTATYGRTDGEIVMMMHEYERVWDAAAEECAKLCDVRKERAALGGNSVGAASLTYAAAAIRTLKRHEPQDDSQGGKK